MSNIVYERHLMSNPSLPFIFHTDSVYTPMNTANWHDNTEFLYCIEGSGIVCCDNLRIPMEPGNTIVINARRLHTVSAENFVKYHCFIVDNSYFLENGIDIQGIKFCERICDNRSGSLIQKIADLCSDQNDKYHITATRLAVLEFIYYITKNYSCKNDDAAGDISKSYAAVLDSIEYINNHFTEKLSLDDIASKVGFSRFHFARVFRQNTGVTLVEHINARRCDTAAFLLRETKKSISEISCECGFENPSYFAKAFCKARGILPSEYRQKYSKSRV